MHGGFKAVDQAMATGVAEKVFPGGVLLCAQRETVLFHRGFGVTDLALQEPVTEETVFDLASLTKPLATALAVADLAKQGAIRLTTPLSALLGQSLPSDKAGITVDMLLRHTAGLPAHREYFRQISEQDMTMARAILRQKILEEPLVTAPGQQECYSDLGYILLAWVVERVAGVRLDQMVTQRIYQPLGIDRLGFSGIGILIPEWCRNAAATSYCSWRKKMLRGEVEDENAWAAGGVEGHAGLFGTAGAVHRLCCEILDALACDGPEPKVLAREVMAELVRRYPNRTRVAGFDTPSGDRPAAGRFSAQTVIGHLGFTGTSFWMDPGSGVVIILLTNRVHPSRENLMIKKFRPWIHDLVFKAFKRISPL